ncbi:MAG: hypothetical protein AAF892_06875 [Cyanobacteria bacterium P01_D01_bin.71]
MGLPSESKRVTGDSGGMSSDGMSAGIVSDCEVARRRKAVRAIASVLPPKSPNKLRRFQGMAAIPDAGH